jgi:uncharacterized membrane protein YuzA (DUF378 family)
MKALHVIAFILVIIGGLNWLLIGLFSTDLVAWLLGAGSTLSRIVYILVGLSAIVLLCTHKKNCMCCKKDMPMSPSAPQM